MRARNKECEPRFSELILADTPTLQFAISAGKNTAEKVGDEAHARVKVNRLVLWNVNRIYAHLAGKGMTERSPIGRGKMFVNTQELKQLLSVGYSTATLIGENADAKVQIGSRTLWNLDKIEKYVDEICR
jgi:hypothetical protein